MPVGHMVLKIYVPCKNFHVPSQYLYKPCKAYVYCWENKYMPRLKNHLPSRAHNHKILCALRQDLHAPSMWARLNVEPCDIGNGIWFASSLHGIFCHHAASNITMERPKIKFRVNMDELMETSDANWYLCQCVSEQDHNWFRQWHVTYLVPSH